MALNEQENVFKSVCRICHGGCSMLLSVTNDKLTKVKPVESPFNRGQMCIKGHYTPEMMYHPARLLKPLKRIGNRGEQKWQEINWDIALNEIAEQLDKIRQTLGVAK